MSYSVDYAQSIYESQVEPLPADERAEIDAHVKRLEKDPFPGNDVFRVRVSGTLRGFAAQPLFAARTPRFVAYHTVQGDRVAILGVFPASLKP